MKTEKDDWKTGKAPWAFDDCIACEGSGWASKAGLPCRICSTQAMRSSTSQPSPMLFNIKVSKGGVPQYRLKLEDATNGSLPDTKKQETVPKEEEEEEETSAFKPVAAEKVDTSVKSKAPRKKRAKKVEPPAEPEGMTLCLGCLPLKTSKEVKYLDQILVAGPVGDRIAKDLDADSFLLANPFQRRDLIRHYAEKICEKLQGKVLVISMSDTDGRETHGAFIPFAETVIRGY